MTDSEFLAPVAGAMIPTAARRVATMIGSEGAYERDQEYFLNLARRALHAAFPDGVDVIVDLQSLVTQERLHDAADAILLGKGFSPTRTPAFNPTPYLWEARWAIEGALGLPSTSLFHADVFTGIPDSTADRKTPHEPR